MKLIHYTEAAMKVFDDEKAKGVTGRVLIGKQAGAAHFCMRSFEVMPGGHTPHHTHPWEHEIFFHSGLAQVLINGEVFSAQPGMALYVAPHKSTRSGMPEMNRWLLCALFPPEPRNFKAPQAV